MMSASVHSINRAMERCNIKNRQSAERSIFLAMEHGKRAEDYTSWERTYLNGIAQDGCTAIAHNGFCYIVSDQETCVTVYALPAWFGKKKAFDGKERIRNRKKYSKYYPAEYEQYALRT